MPFKAYVIDVSYFSGKLEAYLRYKEIPFERIEVSWQDVVRVLGKHTGIARVPAVETPDGEWLYDTTPMLDWFEARFPEPPIVPQDPVQGFAARLLEDYADEWLWRPALHYRWSYRPDALHLSRRIAAEAMGNLWIPQPLLRWNLRRRQKKVYVTGDGVSDETRGHVEQTYLGSLALPRVVPRAAPGSLRGAARRGARGGAQAARELRRMGAPVARRPHRLGAEPGSERAGRTGAAPRALAGPAPGRPARPLEPLRKRPAAGGPPQPREAPQPG